MKKFKTIFGVIILILSSIRITQVIISDNPLQYEFLTVLALMYGLLLTMSLNKVDSSEQFFVKIIFILLTLGGSLAFYIEGFTNFSSNLSPVWGIVFITTGTALVAVLFDEIKITFKR